MSAIFISHSHQNTDAARQLLEALRHGGFDSVFFDADKQKGIQPGDEWETVLYRRVRACQAMIALVSEDWLASDWCKTEIRQARALGKQIFPARLDDSRSDVLGEIQYADLRGDNQKDPRAYESLLSSLERAKVSKGRWDRMRAPYPGLMAFEEADAGVFFGREREVKECVERMNELREKPCPSWLVVVGASGCGKSSLVRAGVVPALRRDSRKRWVVIEPLRRGNDPFDTMALATARAFGQLGRHVDALALRNVFWEAKASELLQLARELRFAADSADATALVVVDQLEELLTAKGRQRSGGARESINPAGRSARELDHRFLRLLRALAELDDTRPFFVLSTLRADFLGAFQTDAALLGLRSSEIVAKPLELAELPRVILEPATLADVAFEAGLVDEIVRDTLTQDALPLLAFALRELYDRYCADGLLTRDEYRELGGLQAAVANRAEEVLSTLHAASNVTEDEELRAAFLSLVQPGDSGQEARRRIQRRELSESLRLKLEQFVNARLLVVSEAEGTDPVLEVAHEALFRSWKRFNDWIAQSREFLAWRKRFDGAVERWERSARAKDKLLRLPELGEAETWLKKEERLLSAAERDFIQSGLTAERLSKLWLWLGVTAAMLILLGATIFAFEKKRDADFSASEAETQKANAVAASLTARGLALFNIGSRDLDPTLQAVVLREIPDPTPSGWMAAAVPVVNKAMAQRILEGHRQEVIAVAFSPDGDWIVTGSSDRTARVWHVGNSVAPLVLEGHSGPVYSLAFSLDGKRIVTGSLDKTARVWRADGLGQAVKLEGHTGFVSAVAFSPNGQRILTGSADQTARVWNVDVPGEDPRLLEARSLAWITTEHTEGEKILTAEGFAAVFSRDGRKILTGSSDHRARVWNADGTGKPVVLEGHDRWITSVAFSHDGKRVLTGSSDNTARIWNADGSGASMPLKGHANTVTSVSFSSDGKHVLTGSSDGTARVWNADDSGVFVPLRGHVAAINAAVFSPDGKLVLTGSDDHTARLWNADVAGESVELKGHKGPVYSVAFSPDGKRMLTGSSDGTARVWNVEGSGNPFVRTIRGIRGSSVAFTPDGRKVLRGLLGETVREWNVGGTGELDLLKVGPDVNVLAVSSDGRKVLVGSPEPGALPSVRNTDDPGASVALGTDHEVTAAAFSPDGKRVLTALWDKTTLVWNLERAGAPIKLDCKDKAVVSAAFSPDGTKILTGSEDGTAQVCDADGSEPAVDLIGHLGSVRAVAFSRDGKRVVTGSNDKTALVQQADGKVQPIVLEGEHTDAINSVAFSPDGKRVITGSADKTARVWHADGKGRPIALNGHDAGVTSVAFSPDGKEVLTGSSDKSGGTARLWSVDLEDVRMLLWRQTTFCLSPDQRSEMLGETSTAAELGAQRCNYTVERCKVGLDACRQAVSAMHWNAEATWTN